MPLDASIADPAWSREPGQGYCATFHDSGHLASFGFYEDGRPVGPSITLPPDGHSARWHHVTQRDTFDLFGKSTFTAFVKHWVNMVYVFHYGGNCTFCGGQYNDNELVSGQGGLNICDRCLSRLEEIIATSSELE